MVEEKRPRGRPKLVWTKARREARSRAQKKMWAEASPEKRARMKSGLNTYGFAQCSPEELARRHSFIDVAAKGAKCGETKRRKWANGEYEELRKKMSENNKKRWASLSPEEQLKSITALRNGMKFNRKLDDAPDGTKKEYSDAQYRAEQIRLYEMACRAMVDSGVPPKKNQGLGYYRKLIEFFRPDWVDWKM